MGSAATTARSTHPVDAVCDDMMAKMKERLVPTLTRSFRRDLSETLISKKISFVSLTKFSYATVMVNTPEENVQIVADFLVRHLGCSSVASDKDTLPGATLVRPESSPMCIQLLPSEGGTKDVTKRSHADALKHLYDPENGTGDVIQNKLDELFKCMYFRNHCALAVRDMTCVVSSLNENKIPFLGPYERGTHFIIMVPLPHTGVDTFIEVSSSRYDASVGRLKPRPWIGEKKGEEVLPVSTDEKKKKKTAVPVSNKSNEKKQECSKVKKEVKLDGAFKEGDRLMCRYQGFKKFFPAEIVKVNGDLTYNVKYNDGDTESNVKESHITIRADNDEEKEKKDKKKLGEKEQKTEEKIQEKKIESKVSSSSSESSGDEEETKESNERDDGREFSIGNRVRAKFDDGPDWFRGKIESYCPKTETYGVLYDDGDEEFGVPASRIVADK